MPGPSTRKAKQPPLVPAPHPDDEEQRRAEELRQVRNETRAGDEHVESDQEQQARESEKAFEQAVTRMPPG